MSTTTYINLESDNELNAAALEARFRAYFKRDSDRDLDWSISGGDGGLDVNEGGLSLWLNTKYQLEGGRKIARSLSGAFPGASVTFSEEYDDDGYGEEQVAYLNGEVVGEKVSAVVPSNLDELVKELEAALGRRGHERNTAPAVRSAAAALVKAYRA